MGKYEKRKALLEHFKLYNVDIVLLQETHSSEKTQTTWEKEIGRRTVWSHGNSQARGCAIIVMNKKIQVLNSGKDTMGRMVYIVIKIAEQTYVIQNLYAPNEDDATFFKENIQTIESLNEDFHIIGGDLNQTLNQTKDRCTAKQDNTRREETSSTRILHTIMNDMDLADVWRTLHPEEWKYTWSRMKPYYTASRLDYIITNMALVNSIKECEIVEGCRTDHKMVLATINVNEVERGPGIWKINNNILDDEGFRQQIKSTISSTNLTEMDGMKKWEYVKFRCAEVARKYATKKANTKAELLKNLHQLKGIYEEQYLQESRDKECIENSYEDIVAKIQQLEEERTQSVIFRSKANWAKDGEKNTKYFFALEKRNYSNKNMFSVFTENGLCTDQQQILEEQKRFYQQLYTSDRSVDFTLQNHTAHKLDSSQKKQMDERITIEEIKTALDSMKHGKCPGNDGLSVEFYQTFWPELRESFYKMLQISIEKGQLGDSARRGLMQLIPKKDKDSRYIKNMRPLTLLNVDYKIIATTIARRLKTVLPDLIGPQQTGFMTGRSIYSNIRKTMDIITWANGVNKGSQEDVEEEGYVILNLDFTKCFDLIEHKAVYGALKYFNFGETFIKYVKLFYANFSVCTQNNGFTSKYFVKTRSINQGCPLSQFVYLLCGETMTHLLQQNPKVCGVPIYGKNKERIVISQFADDATLFLKATQECLDAAVETLREIQRNTGLTVSFEKSKIHRIGKLKGTCFEIEDTNFQWTDENIDLLGVCIENAPKQSEEQFNKSIDKMEEISQIWYYRNLTLSGKILIINTLMAPLFVYKMGVLPMLNNGQIDRINGIIESFLWQGTRAKIPLYILQRPKSEGGLNLTNFKNKHRSLLLQWPCSVNNDETFENYIYHWIAPDIRSFIWECNLNKSDAQHLDTSRDNFWRDVLSLWAEVNYTVPETPEQILNEIVWYNSHIRCANNIVKPFGSLLDEGLLRIKDFVDDTGALIDYTTMSSKCELQCSWLDYGQLLHAIPKKWKMEIMDFHQGRSNEWVDDSSSLDNSEFNEEDLHIENYKGKPLNLINLIDTKRTSNVIYKELFRLNNSEKDMSRYKDSWNRHVGSNINTEEYIKLFRRIYKVSNVTKFRDFQYRFMLNKTYTNNVLCKWGVVDSETCNLCNLEAQNRVHLFVKCCKVKPLWEYVQDLICCENLSTEAIFALKAMDKANTVENFIILVTKQFIYRCKCLNVQPKINQLKNELKLWQKIEEYNARQNGKLQIHRKKWSNIEIGQI